nr:uncharacterized protein LOC109156241 [Ipomoea batatas]
MDCLLEAEKSSRDQQRKKLGDTLIFDEPEEVSCADLPVDALKNVDVIPPKSKRVQKKKHTEKRAYDSEELVRHMSNLPSYLERGKVPQEKAFNVGVLDWKRLERWQKQYKQIPGRSNGYSPSSSNTSSPFLAEGSSSNSSTGHSSSMHHSTLQCHLNMSSTEGSSGSVNLQELNSCAGKPLEIHRRVPKTTHSSVEVETSLKEFSRDSDLQHVIKNRRSQYIKDDCSTFNGETILEGDNELHISCSNANADFDCKERCKSTVLIVPKDRQESSNGLSSSTSDSAEKLKATRKSFYDVCNHTVSQAQTSSGVSHCCYIHNKADTISYSQTGLASKIDEKGMDLSSILNEPSTYPGKSPSSPPGGKNLESNKSTGVLKNPTTVTSFDGSNPIKENAEATKVRNPSPTRRFRIAISGKGWSSNAKDISTVPSVVKQHNAQSGQERVEGVVSIDHTCDKSSANGRSKSSPLRRLLDPLLKPRKSTSDHFTGSSEVDSTSRDRRSKSAPRQVESLTSRSMKVKLDLKGCKTIEVDNACPTAKHRPLRMQALFQVAVKNGVPLFKFAVENEGNILAATMKQVNSPTKQKNNWIYSFCTIREMKKKGGNWANQGGKDKSRGYISSVIAQMKVSDAPFSVSSQKSYCQSSIREFVLFATETKESGQQISELQPTHELAAIVVKLSHGSTRHLCSSAQQDLNSASAIESGSRGEVGGCSGREDFSMTVILPGGNHGLPGKGEPSPLIERWKSGGSCDCGGWDLGCKLRVLANHCEVIRGSSSANIQSTAGRFELFYQGDDQENKPVFSLCAFKDGIFSVEYSSSLTLLQAFSICISILNVRKQDGIREANSSCAENSSEGIMPSDFPNKAQVEFPDKYISIPPISPVGRV